MNRLLYLAIGLVFLAGCAGEASCSNGAPIELGRDLFCVPSENVRFERRSLLGRVLRLGQTGPEEGALIEFSRADYAAVAPGYQVEQDVNGKEIDRDLVLIVPVSGSTIERVLYRGVGEKYFEDLWFGRGNWGSRLIEPIEGTPWYRAYWFSQRGSSWQVLSAYPDEAAAPHRNPGFWLASCQLTSFGSRNCSSPYFLEQMGLVIELELDERNLVHRDAIARFIRSKLESWKVPE